jgi:hypothetical protein
MISYYAAFCACALGSHPFGNLRVGIDITFSFFNRYVSQAQRGTIRQYR